MSTRKIETWPTLSQFIPNLSGSASPVATATRPPLPAHRRRPTKELGISNVGGS